MAAQRYTSGSPSHSAGPATASPTGAALPPTAPLRRGGGDSVVESFRNVRAVGSGVCGLVATATELEVEAHSTLARLRASHDAASISLAVRLQSDIAALRRNVQHLKPQILRAGADGDLDLLLSRVSGGARGGASGLGSWIHSQYQQQTPPSSSGHGGPRPGDGNERAAFSKMSMLQAHTESERGRCLAQLHALDSVLSELDADLARGLRGGHHAASGRGGALQPSIELSVMNDDAIPVSPSNPVAMAALRSAYAATADVAAAAARSQRDVRRGITFGGGSSGARSTHHRAAPWLDGFGSGVEQRTPLAAETSSRGGSVHLDVAGSVAGLVRTPSVQSASVAASSPAPQALQKQHQPVSHGPRGTSPSIQRSRSISELPSPSPQRRGLLDTNDTVRARFNSALDFVDRVLEAVAAPTVASTPSRSAASTPGGTGVESAPGWAARGGASPAASARSARGASPADAAGVADTANGEDSGADIGEALVMPPPTFGAVSRFDPFAALHALGVDGAGAIAAPTTEHTSRPRRAAHDDRHRDPSAERFNIALGPADDDGSRSRGSSPVAAAWVPPAAALELLRHGRSDAPAAPPAAVSPEEQQQQQRQQGAEAATSLQEDTFSRPASTGGAGPASPTPTRGTAGELGSMLLVMAALEEGIAATATAESATNAAAKADAAAAGSDPDVPVAASQLDNEAPGTPAQVASPAASNADTAQTRPTLPTPGHAHASPAAADQQEPRWGQDAAGDSIAEADAEATLSSSNSAAPAASPVPSATSFATGGAASRGPTATDGTAPRSSAASPVDPASGAAAAGDGGKRGSAASSRERTATTSIEPGSASSASPTRQSAGDGPTSEVPSPAERDAHHEPSRLPTDWTEKVDPKSGKPYYYNRSTKQTTWTHPAGPKEEPNTPASPGSSGDWAEKVDPRSGKPYYYNRATKETTWTKPAVLASSAPRSPETVT